MNLMNTAATTKAFATMTHSFSAHQQCGGLLQIARKEKKQLLGEVSGNLSASFSSRREK